MRHAKDRDQKNKVAYIAVNQRQKMKQDAIDKWERDAKKREEDNLQIMEI